MKKRHLKMENETQRLQMTPLIDVVFLLLTFFIMTLKIIAPEGDFGIKMPLSGAAQASTPEIDTVEKIDVHVQADADGNLRNIIFGSDPLGPNPRVLQQRVIAYLGDAIAEENRDRFQVQFHFDPHLHYGHTIEAVSAVSGYRSEGRVIPLIENITFAEKK